MKDTIGTLISEVRKEKGLTQQELADKIHVTKQAVSKWETGKGFPDITLLEPLSEALDISMSELISGKKIVSTESLLQTEEILKILLEQTKNKLKSQKMRMLAISTLIIVLIFFVVGIYLKEINTIRHTISNDDFKTCVIFDEKNDDSYMYLVTASNYSTETNEIGKNYGFKTDYIEIINLEVVQEILDNRYDIDKFNEYLKDEILLEEYLGEIVWNQFKVDHNSAFNLEYIKHVCSFPEAYNSFSWKVLPVDISESSQLSLIHSLYNQRMEIYLYVQNANHEFILQEGNPKIYSVIEEIIFIEEE